MFTTDRLTLRAFRDSDLPDLLRINNDYEVQRLTWDGYVVPRTTKFGEMIKDRVSGLEISPSDSQN